MANISQIFASDASRLEGQVYRKMRATGRVAALMEKQNFPDGIGYNPSTVSTLRSGITGGSGLAISCIRNAAVPRPPSEKEIIQHADIILGRRYLLMSGTNDAFDTLLEMAKAPLPPAVSDATLMSEAYNDSSIVRQFPNV